MKKKSVQNEVLDRILTKVVGIASVIEEQMVTKDEFREFRSDIFDYVDGFVKLHQTLDTEVASLRHGYDRLDGRITRVEKKIGLEPA